MTLFGGLIGFTAPWLLLGLVSLPVLWLILRAVPPAPLRRLFPGVVLLLGLQDEEQVTDRTPWWLLLLRILAVAAVIIGLAGPVLNPEDRDNAGAGPLLVLLDGSWAAAADWTARQETLEAELIKAGRADRPVAIVRLTTPETPQFLGADIWRTRLAGLVPQPWQPSDDAFSDLIEDLGSLEFDTLWFSDGLARDGRAGLLTALETKGDVRVVQSTRPVLGLQPPEMDEGALRLTVRRSAAIGGQEVVIAAYGRDPSGQPGVLARVPARFEDDELAAEVSLSLPSELRARLTRFEVEGRRSAGAVSLPDDSLRRREVALVSGREDREGLELLSPLHYLDKALSPSADLLNGGLSVVLPANPDVIILADVAVISPAEAADLLEWAENGGLLLRFAGPRLAASDVSRSQEDPLLPVRLRAGGRSVGGALSWGEPKSLAPFPKGSPFFGLSVPEDVTVTAQVVAQPDPTLAERVIAQLSDGTPLVTRKRIGQGQVVLIHVTANTEWSGLPLSGLFVQMLERLAISSATEPPSAEELAGTIWQPQDLLDGFGQLRDAGSLPGVAGDQLVSSTLGPNLRPGIYRGEDRSIARNVVVADTILEPAIWPGGIPVQGLSQTRETLLAGWLLGVALLLLLIDIVASLALGGRLRGGGMALPLFVITIMLPRDAMAQDDRDAFALVATHEVVLAHVLTGDQKLDQLAEAGLRGLSETLFFRTSVEPSTPVGVNLELDEIAFFPLLYWPISSDQPVPSDVAFGKLNDFLRSGGMILFDTRDADIARFGAASPNGRKLQQLASGLDIPPLEPLPADHVLTRTFYLLQDFPGRHASRDVWVEAAPPDAKKIEGMPFRNLNDGVTPVVIGGNDWASAWATDARGNALYPVGRGLSGERQRELAYRFGINLVMHVLTGNYKSDQVHVPALLDRLGQ